MDLDCVDTTSTKASPATTLAHALLETLAARGVSAAFGIPGGLIAPLFDAIEDVGKIRLINTRHEGIAAFAAIGHTLATGTPALVLTTGGPGITNALTGIAAAKEECAPIVFIGGDVPHSATARAAIQDGSANGIDVVALMRTVTKASMRIEHAAGAVGLVEHALRIAMTEPRGPVFIALPVDLTSQIVHPMPLALSTRPPPELPDLDACRELARALLDAKRPLIVAGNGARAAAAPLRELAERTGSPVVTTPHSKGVFPDGHPLSLGGIGLGGHPSALKYLSEGPDVVCIVGSRSGDFATNGWSLSLMGTAATYQIDREARLLGRNTKLTLGIVGDARLVIEETLAQLPTDCAGRKRSFERTYLLPETLTSESMPITPARALRALQRTLPTATFFTDQGEHCAYALHYLLIDQPDRFYSLVGFASMGSGFGAAIGHAAATKSRPTVAIVGDGGFAMHAGDILTCVEEGIPLVFAVINDGRWNMVHHGFTKIFGRTVSSFPAHVADLAGVAREFGAIGVRVEHPQDLNVDRITPLLAMGRPIVLDIRIDPSRALSIHSRVASVKDFVAKA